MNQEQMNKVCEDCGGLCCKVQTCLIVSHDDFQREFWEAKGPVKTIETKEGTIYLMPQPCQHQLEDGKCGIYDTRPQLCKDFPGKYIHRTWTVFCPLFRIYRDEAKQRTNRLLVL